MAAAEVFQEMMLTSDSLQILGIFRLPIPIIHLDFYLLSNFALPADGLLVLSLLKHICMVIHPGNNSVKSSEKSFRPRSKYILFVVLPLFVCSMLRHLFVSEKKLY